MFRNAKQAVNTSIIWILYALQYAWYESDAMLHIKSNVKANSKPEKREKNVLSIGKESSDPPANRIWGNCFDDALLIITERRNGIEIDFYM